MMQVQWYPGHMTKARRMMQEDMKLIDLVIELLDARIPRSSRNPDIDELAKGKSRLVLLNKADLADSRANDDWKKYFEDNLANEIQPKFYSQGSFAMKTILNPIKDDDGLAAYDLDDGVYFFGNSKEDKKTIQWYHDKVKDAVDGHTDQPPTDKNACVRVNYADGHHIDLPIYFWLNGDAHPQLAHKNKPWIKQDAIDFKNWFEEQCKKKKHLV